MAVARLNLGCGQNYHPDWVNLDMYSSSPLVRAHNLLTGIPFGAATFDAVYHSHVLEHFSQSAARRLLEECLRVLKPGGVLRVVVPDLEAVAVGYLESLRRATTDDSQAASDRHTWMLLEMLDQTTRDRSGGDMVEFLTTASEEAVEFAAQRMGDDGARLVHQLRHRDLAAGVSVARSSARQRSIQAIRTGVRGAAWRVIEALSPALAAGLRVARFRASGENHIWMYDRYSLVRLLLLTGFDAPHIVSADQSAIPDWSDSHLDSRPDGTQRKPYSLYVEARKPEA